MSSTIDVLDAKVDSARDRSASYATLIVTILGALVAGFVFSDIGNDTNDTFRWCGGISICLLLVSLASYVMASQFRARKDESAPTKEPSLPSILIRYRQDASNDLSGIEKRTKCGNWTAGLAIGLVIVAIIWGADTTQRAYISVQVSSLPKELHVICPEIDTSARFKVEKEQLNSPSTYVIGQVAPDLCPGAHADRLEIILPKENLLVWHQPHEY